MISPDSTDMLQLNDLISYSKSIEKNWERPIIAVQLRTKKFVTSITVGSGRTRVEKGGEVDDILVVTK